MSEDLKEMIATLSKGNPGALSVLVQLVNHSNTSVVFIPVLEKLNITGSRIWMLYKDVCWEDLSKMIVVLQAYALDILTLSQVNGAIDRDVVLDLDSLTEQINNF